MTEHDLIAAGHPRYVSALGDSRTRAVPCSRCRRPTLALSPLLCLRCDPIVPAGCPLSAAPAGTPIRGGDVERGPRARVPHPRADHSQAPRTGSRRPGR